ncbi:tetratricopeptide repeat protein [Streptomyces paromomycinus]|uniref:NTPase n=1 Tax=Streptomyces paromomycinus TaxID=92743 RepID=A0A401VXM6_STREY|nr:tetratricopeptide repeat protein [Streptomyces paromomycinus]GCD41796.1 NTPase [Streptomyces paromomycinus]
MTTNGINGSAIYGLAVQAKAVFGGIHHHAPAAPYPVPRQMPPPPPYFTNRTEQLHALETARTAGATIVAITGLAGAGKTGLATHWLHNQSAYTDGHLYADLRTHAASTAPQAVLSRWLRALGLPVPSDDLQELAGLWRSATADLAVALLLDNATSAAEVRPLLPGGASSLAVVTSRTTLGELAADGAAFTRVGPLAPTASIELLGRVAGTPRLAADPEAAAAIADACAHLPLPLVLAGARLAARPERPLRCAADALTAPADTPAHPEDRVRMAITTALTATYTSLDADAQRLYRYLGLLPTDDIDPDLAAAAGALTWATADWLLEVLADEQLLEPLAADSARLVRYRMPAAVREHACTLAAEHDSEQERTGVRRRLCEWMLLIATHAQARLTPAQATLRRATEGPPPPARLPFTDDAGALNWLDSHQHNLLGLLRAAETAAWYDTAWKMVDAFWPLFQLRHPYTLWTAAHEIGLAAARSTNNPAAQRQMLASGAIGLAAAGRSHDAIDWYTGMLNAARDSADDRDEGQAHLGLGSCHLHAGRPHDAEQHLDQAVARWEECGYLRGVGLALIVLGETALATDAPCQALSRLDRARTLLLDAQEPYEAARALALHGHTHVLLGRIADGITEMEAALETVTQAGSTLWQARTLELLAQAHQATGARERARLHYRRSAELYRQIRPAEADRIRRLLQAL